MKTIFSTLAFVFICATALANDGAFYSSGEQIFPMKETTVSLKKEILDFKYTGDEYISVNVYFEFFNPGEAKDVLVGFESPGATGDVASDSSFIKNFTVNHDGKKLKFRHSVSPPRSGKSADDYEPYKHIFSFEVRFKNGINVIRHSYQYKGSDYVGYKKGYSYILTTGNRWANSEIGDFELNIDMGSGVLFQLPHSLAANSPADWKLTGQGKSRVYDISDWEDSVTKQVRFMLESGLVRLKAQHFSPASELQIIVYSDAFQSYSDNLVKNDSFIEELMRCVYEQDPEQLCKPEKLDKTLVRKFKNYFYAVKGYSFKDAELRKFFDQYEWYHPDPKLRIEDIKFEGYNEKEPFNKALELEKFQKQESGEE